MLIMKVMLTNESTTNFWYNLNKMCKFYGMYCDLHILWDILRFAYLMGCTVICIFDGMYCDSFTNAIYLVHDDDEWQFGLVKDAAGIKHVGHEGHRVHTASCVHHIHYYGRIGGGLQWDDDDYDAVAAAATAMTTTTLSSSSSRGRIQEMLIKLEPVTWSLQG